MWYAVILSIHVGWPERVGVGSRRLGRIEWNREKRSRQFKNKEANEECVVQGIDGDGGGSMASPLDDWW